MIWPWQTSRAKSFRYNLFGMDEIATRIRRESLDPVE
jgi:hypothetical protein